MQRDFLGIPLKKCNDKAIIPLKKCNNKVIIPLKKCNQIIYHGMLKRKIEAQLIEWKADTHHKPLVIKGVRQCGKTYIAEKFAQDNYKNVVYVNFIKTPSACIAFDGNLDVDNIITGLSTVIPNADFEEKETCLIWIRCERCRCASLTNTKMIW